LLEAVHFTRGQIQMHRTSFDYHTEVGAFESDPGS